jgi:hypothetical protein
MVTIKEINEITNNFNNLKNEINAFINKAKENGIEISQNDFFDVNQEENKRFVYYIDGKKFTTENCDEIPFDDISSPNVNTPALKNSSNEYEVWCKKGYVWHRLLGPAAINSIGEKFYYLNGKRYNNIQDWLKEHPNQDENFKKEMIDKYEKRGN